MKLAIKKFVYLLNDVTNLLLNKEKQDYENQAKKLKIILIIICAVLTLSLALNIYFIL